jgi:tripartite-type tricarboxylate transporter receptor subunit TctC
MGNTDISYDEFTPVATLMRQPNLLVVKVNAPYDTFEEFVAYVKEHPGQVKIGNSGEGSIPKLSAQSVEKALGLNFKYVTYYGDTNSITAVISGEVDATFCSAAPAMGQINAKTVKILTVTDNKRMDSFPDVPAMGEVYPELSNTRILTWVYLAVKKDVSKETITYLQDLFAKASAADKFKAAQKSFSIEKTSFEGLEKEAAFMKDQHDFCKELLGK